MLRRQTAGPDRREGRGRDRAGAIPAAPSSVPAPSSSSDERNGQSSGRASSSATRRPSTRSSRTSRGRSPSATPAIAVPERTSGNARSNPRASLTVGATRSSVRPVGHARALADTRRRRTRSAPEGRRRRRWPATACEPVDVREDGRPGGDREDVGRASLAEPVHDALLQRVGERAERDAHRLATRRVARATGAGGREHGRRDPDRGEDDEHQRRDADRSRGSHAIAPGRSGLSFRAGSCFVCAPMPSRRVFAVLAVLFVVGTACSGDEVQLPEAPRTPADDVAEPTGSTGPEPGAQPPASGGSLASIACSLPHEWLLRTWRGNSEDRSAEIQILPIEPNFVGSGLPHVGPWDYAQDIPMFWYGPGHIAPAGVGRPPGHARRHRADAGAAARVPVPRDRRLADDRGDRRQPDAAAPPRHDGVGRGRPQRPRTLEERLAVPAVADPAGRVVRARDRRHQPDLHRADARHDRHRRVPRRAPDRRAPAADRRGPHDTVGQGSRVPDGADARRPLRPRDGQRAGRRRDRDRQHPPRDARARRDVGRRRPGHRRGPREDRGGHARRRGFGLEPHARAHRPTTGSPTTSTRSAGSPRTFGPSTRTTARSTASGGPTTSRRCWRGSTRRRGSRTRPA